MVILDTNIIIDHLRSGSGKDTWLRKLVEKEGYKSLSLSIISIQELFSGTSTRVELMKENLLATIAPIQLLPYTFAIAQYAGVLIGDAKQTCTFVDAAIVATALVHDIELISLDKKLYSISPRIQVYSLIT